MTSGELAACAGRLADSPAFQAKRDIAAIAGRIPGAPRAVAAWRPQGGRILLGDDTAAIPDGGGHLLFAAEGILPELLERDPWFAGFSAVMVNVNDVAAMGGYPLAVVDVYFQGPQARADQVLGGMNAACAAYGVPLVGGHTTRTAAGPHALAVAVLGRADHLLTSFAARPGDELLLGVDLRGAYRERFPFFDAATGADPERLRGDLAVLAELAEAGAVHACKDVSNAGVAGTLLMMCEASGVGGVLDLDALPRPAGIAVERWLATFPSHAFLFAAAPERAQAIERAVRGRGLACERVGRADGTGALRLTSGGADALLWDLRATPFTGFGPGRAPVAEPCEPTVRSS